MDRIKRCSLKIAVKKERKNEMDKNKDIELFLLL